MGTGETGTPSKAAKVPVALDQHASQSPYPEWAAAFHAYYNPGGQAPHGYFHSSVPSGPPPHSYLWGAQPLMPPYGTQLPSSYGAVYPHRGIYSHAALATYGLPTSVATSNGTPLHTRPPAAEKADRSNVFVSNKDRTSTKRAKGILCTPGFDALKGSPLPANDMFSQSNDESVSEGSSEASENDSTQNVVRKRGLEQLTLDGGEDPAGAECTKRGVSASVTPNSSVGVQDYWSTSGHGPLECDKRTSANPSSGLEHPTLSNPVVSRNGVPEELWLQDEQEVKRQRRKQSNRESARRSRLKKQAECEELGRRVDALAGTNMALRSELTRLSEECKKLTAENASLLEQLQKSKEGFEGVPPDPGKSSQDALQPVQPVQVLGVSKGVSAQRQGARHEEEVSCDSTGKVSPAVDSGCHPEAFAAG